MATQNSKVRGRLYNQTREEDEDEREPDATDIETTQIDYRGQKSSSEEPTLPPAWNPEPSTWSVGYEPVGETSIGVEQERQMYSRRRTQQVNPTKLAEHNEGRHPSDGNQGTRMARLDKKRITQALCSSLDIGGLLQQEAVRAVLLLDLRRFGPHKKIEKVALAVICVVVDYHRRYKRRDTTADRLGSNPTFKMLSHEIGLADTHIQLSQMVKDELTTARFFEPGSPGLGLLNETDYHQGELGAHVDKPLWMSGKLTQG